MQVKHRLLSTTAIINNQPESLANAQLTGYLTGSQQQVPQQFFIFCLRISQFGNKFFGNKQHVLRCLGIAILKSETELIFINDISGDFTADYFAEQSIWISFYLFSVSASGQWFNWSIAGCLLLVS